MAVKRGGFCKEIRSDPILRERAVCGVVVSFRKRCPVVSVRRYSDTPLWGKAIGHLNIDLTAGYRVFDMERRVAVLLDLRGEWSLYVIVVVVVTVGFLVLSAGVFSEVELITVVPLIMFTVVPGS